MAAIDNTKREMLFTVVSEFRAALDRVPQPLWEQYLAGSFPRGACGHCSEMLIRYLRLRLGIEPLYASGNVGHLVSGETHAWVEHDGYFIDISADQFGLARVIVDRASPFHLAISDVDRHPAIIDNWWPTYGAPLFAEALRILDEMSS